MIPLSYNLRSLRVRRTTTIATALGVGLVVFVLAAAMMLANGVQRTLVASGKNDNAIVLRKGSDGEMSSNIEDPTVALISTAPGVAVDAGGKPIAVKELVMVLTLDKLGTDGVSNVQIRGVGENVLAFRPEVRMLEGRMPQPGSDEAVVGKLIRGRFRGVDMGQKVELRKGRSVTVVGVIESGGSSFESEIWADLETVRASFGRQGAVSSVRVRLESPARFDAFEATMEQDKQLGLDAYREDEFYRDQSEGTSLFITAMGSVITVFFSLGAIIGAMITMYGSVAGRAREIGVLRALGFTRTAVLTSFLFESTVLALLGGIVGILASLALGGVQFSMLNFTTFSEMSFGFDPTPEILLGAMLFAGAMGLFGGLLPAVRAAKIPAGHALRD